SRLVNKRKRLLDYLSRTKSENYKKILEKLNIRK
ncbi:MAG: 30S ribosomal protein S15, partial [Candidatus Fonsibacter sp.]